MWFLGLLCGKQPKVKKSGESGRMISLLSQDIPGKMFIFSGQNLK